MQGVTYPATVLNTIVPLESSNPSCPIDFIELIAWDYSVLYSSGDYATAAYNFDTTNTGIYTFQLRVSATYNIYKT